MAAAPLREYDCDSIRTNEFTSNCDAMIPDLNAEWLETDGQGGFASGTVSGIRSRRYHGLLLVATEPPEGRFLMVAGLEVFLEVNGRRIGLAPQRYWPDVVAPVPLELAGFSANPWPFDPPGTQRETRFGFAQRPCLGWVMPPPGRSRSPLRRDP